MDAKGHENVVGSGRNRMQGNVLVQITYSLDRERGLLISSSAVYAAH